MLDKISSQDNMGNKKGRRYSRTPIPKTPIIPGPEKIPQKSSASSRIYASPGTRGFRGPYNNPLPAE